MPDEAWYARATAHLDESLAEGVEVRGHAAVEQPVHVQVHVLPHVLVRHADLTPTCSTTSDLLESQAMGHAMCFECRDRRLTRLEVDHLGLAVGWRVGHLEGQTRVLQAVWELVRQAKLH